MTALSPRWNAVISALILAVIASACTQASGASSAMPQPRELTVPAGCKLIDFSARAYGTSWSVECEADVSVTMGRALEAEGWRRCSATRDEAVFRKGELVTSVAPQNAPRAKLAQFSAGNECE